MARSEPFALLVKAERAKLEKVHPPTHTRTDAILLTGICPCTRAVNGS
jgi:hypothetical protein